MLRERFLHRIKELWRILLHFVCAKKDWHWPRQSAVLIYDADGEEFLLEYLRPWNPEVLHVRGERVNVLVLIDSLLLNKKKNNSYVDCYIGRVRPRLIVTFTDNNREFYSLSARSAKIKTLFIQNGIRSYFTDIFEILDGMKPSTEVLRVDFMATFGRRIGGEYTKYLQGSVVPIGSLRNNLIAKTHTQKSGVICFISQFRQGCGLEIGGKLYKQEDFYEQADKIVLHFLDEYAREHGKELLIVPCAVRSQDDRMESEKAYFRRLLGQNCVFSDWSWHGSSYDAVDTAEVVVSIDSTLGYESIARGNKTAIFSIRSELIVLHDYRYGWPGSYPDEGNFWTNIPDYEIFKRIIDHLFMLNDEQWQAELSDQCFENIMTYDPGNTIFRSIIRSILVDEHKCDV